MRGDWEVPRSNERDDTLAGVGAVALTASVFILTLEAMGWFFKGMAAAEVLLLAGLLLLLGAFALTASTKPLAGPTEPAPWALFE